MKIDTRTATEEDFSFLLDLRRRTLRDYVLETWGSWDESRQETYLLGRLDPPSIRIIQDDGVDIGMLSVEERPNEFFLENILLLPSYQNRGIGTRLLTDILQKARKKGLPVRLQVLKVSPVRGLYERLGFSVVRETDTHYFMENQGRTNAP